MTTLAEQFRDLFAGGKHAFGVYDPDKAGAPDENGIRKGGCTTQALNGNADELILEHWRKHLEGVEAHGPIPLSKDSNRVTFGGVDVDVYPFDAPLWARRCRDLPVVVARTRNGGGRIMLFQTPGVEITAHDLRQKLAMLRDYLGLDKKTELFPKQAKLDEDGTGNWFIAPYFGDTQVAFDGSGKELTAEAFIEYAHSKRTNLKLWTPPVHDGPPCIQRVLFDPELQNNRRNKTLAQYCVYARNRDPDDWEEDAEQFAMQLQPPEKKRDVLATIKSHRRNEYGFQCNEFEDVCDREACRKRRFGIGFKTADDESSNKDFVPIFSELHDPDDTDELPTFEDVSICPEADALAKAIEREIAIPYGASMCGALFALASAVGPKAKIHIGETFHRHLNQYLLLVGNSSWGKSPVLSYFTQRPAQEVRELVENANDQRRLEWSKAMAIYKAAMQAYRTALNRALEHDPTLENFSRMPPKEPLPLRLLKHVRAGSTNAAALAEQIEPMVVGATFVADDGRRILDSDDVELLALIMHAGFNEAHDHERVDATRIRRLIETFLCLYVGLQPGVLASAMSAKTLDEGLAARFQNTFHYPRGRNPKSVSGDVPSSILGPWSDKYAAIFKAFFDLDEHKDFSFTEEAQAAFRERVIELKELAKFEEGPMQSHLRKMDTQLARVATLLHIARLPTDGARDAGTSRVDLTNTFVALAELEDAHRIVLAQIEHARAIYGSASEFVEHMRIACRWIKESKHAAKSFTTTDCYSYCSALSSRIPFEHLKTVLSALTSRGILCSEAFKNGGVRWHVNPQYR